MKTGFTTRANVEHLELYKPELVRGVNIDLSPVISKSTKNVDRGSAHTNLTRTKLVVWDLFSGTGSFAKAARQRD